MKVSISVTQCETGFVVGVVRLDTVKGSYPAPPAPPTTEQHAFSTAGEIADFIRRELGGSANQECSSTLGDEAQAVRSNVHDDWETRERRNRALDMALNLHLHQNDVTTPDEVMATAARFEAHVTGLAKPDNKTAPQTETE